jgi:predicted nuclease with TOPRIM domain
MEKVNSLIIGLLVFISLAVLALGAVTIGRGSDLFQQNQQASLQLGELEGKLSATQAQLDSAEKLKSDAQATTMTTQGKMDLLQNRYDDLFKAYQNLYNEQRLDVDKDLLIKNVDTSQRNLLTGKIRNTGNDSIEKAIIIVATFDGNGLLVDIFKNQVMRLEAGQEQTWQVSVGPYNYFKITAHGDYQ